MTNVYRTNGATFRNGKWHDVEMTVEIDWLALSNHFAGKLVDSKGKRSKLLNGGIIAIRKTVKAR